MIYSKQKTTVHKCVLISCRSLLLLKIHMQVRVSKKSPPIGVAIVSDLAKAPLGLHLAWGNDTSMVVGNEVTLSASSSIIR